MLFTPRLFYDGVGGEKMDILEQERCIECGEFYHFDYMNGKLCIACSEGIDDEENDED